MKKMKKMKKIEKKMISPAGADCIVYDVDSEAWRRAKVISGNAQWTTFHLVVIL
jgi:hypothetical protein